MERKNENYFFPAGRKCCNTTVWFGIMSAGDSLPIKDDKRRSASVLPVPSSTSPQIRVPAMWQPMTGAVQIATLQAFKINGMFPGQESGADSQFVIFVSHAGECRPHLPSN